MEDEARQVWVKGIDARQPETTGAAMGRLNLELGHGRRKRKEERESRR